MENNEREQFVEDLLDASLARYSDVAPRPGLEGRILANAKAAHARHRWMMWAGWLAAGAAAALIVMGALSLMRRITIPAPPLPVEVVNAPSRIGVIPGPTTSSQPGVHAVHKGPERQKERAVVALAHNETRPAVFPSPSPATEQEKLLAQYIRTTPTEMLSASILDSKPIQDLEIQPLTVAPMESLAAESNEEK